MKKNLSLNESLYYMKKNMGLKIDESEILQEIDFDLYFDDVDKKCWSLDDVVSYLNNVVSNRGLKTKDRNKFSKDLPYLHAHSKLLGKNTSNGNFTISNIDTFKKNITRKPKELVVQNKKMKKTGNEFDVTYNTGFPAYRGIAYDIEKDEFLIINTCPGAGTCINNCYALAGNYIRYQGAYDNMTRRLNFFLNFPNEYKMMLYKQLEEKCIEHNAYTNYIWRILFRWNDSGDFFTTKYTKMAEEIILELRKNGYNIFSSAHTKMANVVNNSKLDSTSFSYDANKEQRDQIDTNKVTTSVTFPAKNFKDLNFNKIDDLKKLKDRIIDYYDIKNPQDVYFENELKNKKQLRYKKYYVIVTPLHGDAIHRNDIKQIIHTEH